ncbi:hypothetical protein [Prevotellamassilia timonensis]|uniref:hypothetical protein n=1 Tax=Prevotellamassilia timonensis TaxID=1852370 RepID=UPI003A925A53
MVVLDVYDAKIGALSPVANGYGVSKYEIRVWRDEITFGAGCSTLASKARPFLGSFLFAKNVLPKNASTNGGDASRVGIEKGGKYKRY